MAYTPYLNPLTVSLAGMTGSTWTTLSSGVPAGASGAKLQWQSTGSAASAIRGVRKNGSTDTLVTTNSATDGNLAGTPVLCEWNIGVDGSGNFQYWTASASPTEGTMYVVGYYGSESVFLTNAVSISALTTSYATYSCSPTIPSGAVAGFFFIVGGDNSSFLRINGSTDNLTVGALSAMRHWLVGCDSSQNVSAIAANSSRTLYCQGYMTAGLTWHTNAVNVTPGSAGTFQNISQAGGDTGVIANQYYFTSNGQTLQLAGQGASTIISTSYPYDLTFGQYGVYAPSKADLQSITNGTLYELGYFTATSATPSIAWFT